MIVQGYKLPTKSLAEPQTKLQLKSQEIGCTYKIPFVQIQSHIL